MTDADRSEPLFEALADATRRRVLVALATAGPATSTQLAAAFPVTRQAIAKHLQVLATAGVVQAEHRGRETRWTFVPGSLAPAAGWLAALESEAGEQATGQAWDDSVSALQRHLDEQRRKRGLGTPSAPSAPSAPAAAPGGLQVAASKQRPR